MEIEIISQNKLAYQPASRGKKVIDTVPEKIATHRIILEKEQAEPPVSDQEIKKLLKNLRREMLPFNSKLRFKVNKEINRIVVKVIDKNTDKVIKEIPPAQIQRMIAAIRRSLGLLVDTRI